MSADRPGKGLGMGLSALLGERPGRPAPELQAKSRGAYERSRSRGSGPIPNQPRMHFSEESIDELAESIRSARRAAANPAAAERRWLRDRRRRAPLACRATRTAAHHSGDRPRDRRIDDGRARADREYPACRTSTRSRRPRAIGS